MKKLVLSPTYKQPFEFHICYTLPLVSVSSTSSVIRHFLVKSSPPSQPTTVCCILCFKHLIPLLPEINMYKYLHSEVHALA